MTRWVTQSLSVENEFQAEEDASGFFRQSSRPPPIQGLDSPREQQNPRETWADSVRGTEIQAQHLGCKGEPRVDGLESASQRDTDRLACPGECSLSPSRRLPGATMDLPQDTRLPAHGEEDRIAFAASRASGVRAIRKLFLGRLPPEATRGTRS